MKARVCKLIKMQEPIEATIGLLSASGNTVPVNGTTGYATGCTFKHTDGTAGTSNYQNEGDAGSCTFAAVAGLTAAQEALLSATAGVATASKAVILDADGAIASGTMVISDMAAGTGISTGTNTICEHRVSKLGGLFKTEILIDMTGLTSATAGTIIGKAGGTANCHIGQITAAKNGTIAYGQITCLETPAGGDPDIDFYGSADEATGAQAAALATITGEAQLLNHGDWTGAVATPIALTTLPDADGYMYMIDAGGTAVIYTAGIFLLEMWGV